MPVLLFISQTEPTDSWKRALERALPGIEVRIWPESGSRESVDYVLCWKPPAGVFRGMDNLKAVFSLGAGIDHLFTATSGTTMPNRLERSGGFCLRCVLATDVSASWAWASSVKMPR